MFSNFFKAFFRILFGLATLAGIFAALMYLLGSRSDYIHIYGDDDEEMF